MKETHKNDWNEIVTQTNRVWMQLWLQVGFCASSIPEQDHLMPGLSLDPRMTEAVISFWKKPLRVRCLFFVQNTHKLFMIPNQFRSSAANLRVFFKHSCLYHNKIYAKYRFPMFLVTPTPFPTKVKHCYCFYIRLFSCFILQTLIW